MTWKGHGKIIVNYDSLEHSFIPENLPTREDIRSRLYDHIIRFLEAGRKGFMGIHIFGNVGTGKTVLSRRIGKDISETFGSDVVTCYVNCRLSRRIYRVVADIAQQLSEDLPKRGLSMDEFIELIFIVVNEKASRMLLILDEIDALFRGNEAKKTTDALYSLSRFLEKPSSTYDLRLVVLSVSRDPSALYKWLDPATRASFIHLTKHLPPYTPDDLFQILRYRAQLALRDGAITDDSIRFLANFVGKQQYGNARIAIDILRTSALIAERMGSSTILPRHLRLAINECALIPSIDIETLLGLGKQKLLLLLAIVQGLMSTNRNYITKQQAQEYYNMLCEEYGEKPRKSTQIWRYLKELEHELKGIMEIYVSGKNQKGRSTRISINVPLEELERYVVRVLKETEKYP